MEEMTIPVCLFESATGVAPHLTLGLLMKANVVILWQVKDVLTTDCLCAAGVFQTWFYFAYKAFFCAVDRWRFSTRAGEARDVQGRFITSTVLAVMFPSVSRL